MKKQENNAIDLTRKVKEMARELGADIVGIAPVERFSNAPLMHSPQGLMPTAKSVVVIGVSWLDASMELTEKEIAEHWYNPYDQCEVLTNMNARINSIVFNLSKFLESYSYASLPLPASGPGYWRWRPYKDVKEPFAPPLAHRYAAVAAGLGEIGWHESFISPKYGPRIRINSLITEAPLTPDPLYEGPPLCDKCMKCVKACPYDRFRKEVEGTKEMDIGGKKFTIPLTNKWRCFLCYFEINPRFLPKKITEEVAMRITQNPARTPQWIADNAACLCTCLPPSLRQKDDNLYPNSISRKREIKKVDVDVVTEKIVEKTMLAGLNLYVGTKKEFLKEKIDIDQYMPGASSVVLFGSSCTDEFMRIAAQERAKNLLFDLSHYLQELGYYTLPVSRLSEDTIKRVFGIEHNDDTAFQHLLTAMPLKSLRKVIMPNGKRMKITSQEIKAFALEKGADLAGITSVKRLDGIDSSLKSVFSKDETVVVENMPKDMSAWVREDSVGFNIKAIGIEKIKMKVSKDYLSDAKSVIVLGVHYPHALQERVAQTPAEDIGSYSAVNWFMELELYSVAFDMAVFLRKNGYKAVATLDLEDLALQRKHIRNRFPAVAAGLGELGWCGKVLTPEYGASQGFVAIITDAELEQDALYDESKLCEECFNCALQCPVKAISTCEKSTFKVENKTFEFGKVDRLKCEWAKRFGFTGEAGPKYMGSEIDFAPPSKITAECINETIDKIREMDTIERICWNVSVERCVCPVKGRIGSMS